MHEEQIESDVAHAQPEPGEASADAQTSVLPPSLLDRLTDSFAVGEGTHQEKVNPLRQFAAEKSIPALMKLWLGVIPQEKAQLDAARVTLSRDIARIDQLLSEQVNEILHAPQFQALESAWRGLHYIWKIRAQLVNERGFDEKGTELQIRMLDVSKAELKKDFNKASDFDQNALFQKVYEEEFGMAGGTPYGALIADYEFTNHPDDLDLLSELSKVGAAAFAPVITAANPDLIGLDNFSELEKPVNLESIFQQERHIKWRSLRERPDTQFVGLTLPRILMREPYRDDGSSRHGFRFEENVQGSKRENYLWGNAAWAMGGVLMKAFSSCGWFADIRGVERGVDGGGLVSGLPTHSFHTDAFGVATRSSTEVSISDVQESELCDLGFIPLSHCKDTPYSVFYSNQTVHQPATYDDPVANANARISAMLQYVMCCSRIAHYLKVKARSKLGSHLSPMEIQNDLQSWLVQYVTPDEKAPPSMKALYPLREADVQVLDVPGEPGKFMMTIRLLPHYQLDQLSSSMTLVARRVDLKE